MLSSVLSGLSTVKYYIMAALGFGVVVLYALLQSEKKERAQEKLKGIKKARETEKKATNAMVEGLQNEQDVKDNIDTSKRDHFE